MFRPGRSISSRARRSPVVEQATEPTAEDAAPQPVVERSPEASAPEEEEDLFTDDVPVVNDTLVAMRHLLSFAAPPLLGTTTTTTGGVQRRRARTLPAGVPQAKEARPLTNRKVKAGPASLPQLIFQHQLYTQLKNPTVVRREVQDLRESGALFVFDLTPAAFATMQGFGNHQEAVLMEAHEYKKWLQRAGERYRQKQTDTECDPFDAFARLLAQRRVPIFSHDELVLFFQSDTVPKEKAEAMIHTLFTSSLLISHGLHSYAMSLPGLGGWASQLFAGRKELARALKRKRNHECHIHLLEQKGLLQTCFSVAFHLTDLEGLEWATVRQSTTGPVAKLTALGLKEV